MARNRHEDNSESPKTEWIPFAERLALLKEHGLSQAEAEAEAWEWETVKGVLSEEILQLGAARLGIRAYVPI